MYRLIGISCGSDFLMEICKIDKNVEITKLCRNKYIYGNSDCLRYVKKLYYRCLAGYTIGMILPNQGS